MGLLLIKNGRIIDPANKIDKIADLLVEDDRIKDIGSIPLKVDEEIDARGKWVLPGLIDLHVHLRQPGQEHKETIRSGSLAALAGGFTTVAMMPNTKPPVDSAERVNLIKDIIRIDGMVNILIVGAVTKEATAEELTNFEEMAEAGVVAFSDDGFPIMKESTMRQALACAKAVNKIIISHCEDTSISADGVINYGKVSEKLGLKGIPALAEEVMVKRNVEIAQSAGARLHITHISTRGSVELIKDAKQRKINVTCDVTPHHLILTDKDLLSLDPDFKMKPPLRTDEDTQALIKGVEEETIDAIASDHAPHSVEEKSKGLVEAPFGVIGLETTLAVLLTRLVFEEKISLHTLISALTIKPSQILSIDRGTLGIGKIADITIVDPDARWVIDPSKFKSKSRNTPFKNMKVRGKVIRTIVAGKICY